MLKGVVQTPLLINQPMGKGHLWLPRSSIFLRGSHPHQVKPTGLGHRSPGKIHQIQFFFGGGELHLHPHKWFLDSLSLNNLKSGWFGMVSPCYPNPNYHSCPLHGLCIATAYLFQPTPEWTNSVLATPPLVRSRRFLGRPNLRYPVVPDRPNICHGKQPFE